MISDTRRASREPSAPQKNQPNLLSGLCEIIDKYDNFIIDIFGVIHNGIHPFPETIKTLEHLKSRNKQICLLSNSPKRAEGAINQMISMGIASELYDHVVTSGEATFHALSAREDEFHASCGRDCWFIGADWLFESLNGLDLNYKSGPEDASFILNAIPGTESSAVETLKSQLAIALNKNLPMICANPDLVVNIGDQQHECAGTFARIYEDMGGRVVYHGKPHAPVYERCHELLGQTDKSKILAIGDSLHTDIAGAHDFGIDSVFNLVGIHWEEVQLDHTPGEADIEKIHTLVAQNPHRPTYVTNGFSF